MTLKTLHYIRNKRQLQDLFVSQFTYRYIRNEINEIIKSTRTESKLRGHTISTLEATIFMDRNGIPDGYILSPEFKKKLIDYQEEIANKRKSLKNKI